VGRGISRFQAVFRGSHLISGPFWPFFAKSPLLRRLRRLQLRHALPACISAARACSSACSTLASSASRRLVRSADLRSCIDTCSSAFKSVYTVQLVSVPSPPSARPREDTRGLDRRTAERFEAERFDLRFPGRRWRRPRWRCSLGAGRSDTWLRGSEGAVRGAALARGYVVAKALCAVLRWHVVTWSRRRCARCWWIVGGTAHRSIPERRIRIEVGIRISESGAGGRVLGRNKALLIVVQCTRNLVSNDYGVELPGHHRCAARGAEHEG
jgi:hypothetical protein